MSMTTKLESAFNKPRFASLKLSKSQAEAILSLAPHRFGNDGYGVYVSWYETYPTEPIHTRMEVFRVRQEPKSDHDGYQDVYEMRLGVDLPEFITRCLGDKVTTVEGKEILL